mmetsp:Transcript_1595/g.3510  ORF Transcript_1595/g.3510 Transcript_1595/m.3510 type:complete len:335 (+) Transcript_1595:95-1099(+)
MSRFQSAAAFDINADVAETSGGKMMFADPLALRGNGSMSTSNGGPRRRPPPKQSTSSPEELERLLGADADTSPQKAGQAASQSAPDSGAPAQPWLGGVLGTLWSNVESTVGCCAMRDKGELERSRMGGNAPTPAPSFPPPQTPATLSPTTNRDANPAAQQRKTPLKPPPVFNDSFVPKTSESLADFSAPGSRSAAVFEDPAFAIATGKASSAAGLPPGWEWPEWALKRKPPCIEVYVVDDSDDHDNRWIRAIPKARLRSETGNDSYLQCSYDWEDGERYEEDFGPDRVRRIGTKQTVQDVLIDTGFTPTKKSRRPDSGAGVMPLLEETGESWAD